MKQTVNPSSDFSIPEGKTGVTVTSTVPFVVLVLITSMAPSLYHPEETQGEYSVGVIPVSGANHIKISGSGRFRVEIQWS